MGTCIIPDTDSPTVALIAAALYLAEETAQKGETLDDWLARYRHAYRALVVLVEGLPEVRAILPPIHQDGLQPDVPSVPSFGGIT